MDGGAANEYEYNTQQAVRTCITNGSRLRELLNNPASYLTYNVQLVYSVNEGNYIDIFTNHGASMTNKLFVYHLAHYVQLRRSPILLMVCSTREAIREEHIIQALIIAIRAYNGIPRRYIRSIVFLMIGRRGSSVVRL